MQVNGVDHVNIVTDDIEGTAKFYEAVLGFRAKTPPMVMPGFQGRWLCDADDRPIVHLQAYNAERHGERNGAAGGSIDHVALACRGFDDMLRRCAELNLDHRVNDRRFGDLRQIFVTDPNNVSLELNFAGD
ncbi:MAG: VOC family protein [Novosphingobium sp.]|nr:VOC family protein [Novosphingobium sp.]